MKDVNEKKVVVVGDGRHNSMGHSAKYCAYTIFNCTSANIFHFSLAQELWTDDGWNYIITHDMLGISVFY